eukprot:14519890-Heterocapsa_arctica.AAC.1
MSKWSNMVKGIVDSEDLSLVISRKALQQNNLAKKCLEALAEIAEKKKEYMEFYEQFGRCLKLGVHPDQTKIAEHPCWHTSKSSDKQIDMKEH